jgi:SAM-dependent methyltransferase
VDRAGNLSVTGQERFEYVRNLILRDFPPPAKIVEFGSAPGDQVAALAAAGYEATAVDLGAAEDDWGSGEPGYFRALLERAGVENVTWDLEQVPYPIVDDSYDVALLTEVLEHLREYPSRSLAEIFRILKPGGRLYLTTPNAAYLVNRTRLLAGGTVHSPLSDWIGGLPHARHAREYTFGEVRTLLTVAGFSVLFEKSRHFHLHSGRASPAAHVTKLAIDRLAQLRRTLGPSIIVIAEKPLVPH